MNFLQNAAGWIGAKLGFGGRFSTILFQTGYKGEVWLDTHTPNKLYNEIPQVKIVVNKFADLFSNAEIIIEKKVQDGWEKIQDHAAYKIIQQPNFNQGQNTFYKDLCRKFCVYGNNFQYYNRPSKIAGVVSRWNISPKYVKPVLTGKIFDQLEIAGAVSKYIYDDSTTTRKIYETDEILWISDTDLDNPIMGMSRLVTLKYPLSNGKGAYSYLNAIINNKGALGFIVSKNKDSIGSMPISEEDKKKISEQHLQNYGHGSGQTPFKILDGDADFVTTSYPVKEMMLFETIDHALTATAQLFGINTNLFLTETTYENLKNGIIQTYQDTIFSFADMVAQNETKMLKSLGSLKENERIRFSYDHIEILQQNKLQGAQTLERMVNAMNNALANGIITPHQAETVISGLIERIN